MCRLVNAATMSGEIIHCCTIGILYFFYTVHRVIRRSNECFDVYSVNNM